MQHFKGIALVFIIILCFVSCGNATNEKESKAVISVSSLSVSLGIGENDTVIFSLSNIEAYPNISVRFRLGGYDSNVVYLPNETYTLDAKTRDVTVSIETLTSGVTTATIQNLGNDTDLNKLDILEAFVTVSVFHEHWLIVFSTIVGYIYTIAWSVSFYPQIFTNWKRKSVIGLNFDFLTLNIVGFIFYSASTAGLFFNHEIQREFYEARPNQLNQAELNDVVFCFHAVFATLVTISQCIAYERGDQKVSIAGKVFVGALLLAPTIHAILIAAKVLTTHPWFTFLDLLGDYKMLISLIKYIPQAVMNFRRKSTVGWSIGNVLLDITGGTFSFLQLFINSYNFNNWTSIYSNPAKLGLSIISIIFDIIFIIQHYCLYRDSFERLDESDGVNGVVGSASAGVLGREFYDNGAYQNDVQSSSSGSEQCSNREADGSFVKFSSENMAGERTKKWVLGDFTPGTADAVMS